MTRWLVPSLLLSRWDLVPATGLVLFTGHSPGQSDTLLAWVYSTTLLILLSSLSTVRGLGVNQAGSPA